MSKHVTYRGKMIDMDAFRREHEKEVAVGNMQVNAKGDLLQNGRVVKTADRIARENHFTKTTIIKTSIKGEEQPLQDIKMDTTPPVVNDNVQNKKNTKKKNKITPKEVELPSGDIIIEEEKNED